MLQAQVQALDLVGSTTAVVTFVADMKPLLRVAMGVLIAVPSVTMLTLLLFSFPRGFAAGVGISGAAALTATKYVHNKWLAAIGGLLAFSGVLAYALQA